MRSASSGLVSLPRFACMFRRTAAETGAHLMAGVEVGVGGVSGASDELLDALVEAFWVDAVGERVEDGVVTVETVVLFTLRV